MRMRDIVMDMMECVYGLDVMMPYMTIAVWFLIAQNSRATSPEISLQSNLGVTRTWKINCTLRCC